MQLKLTILFLLAFVLQVSADASGQTVTYSAKAVSLPEIFSAIKKQTGCTFFYDLDDLKDVKNVSVQLKQVSLKEAMEIVLANLPLNFEIQGRTVFVTKAKPAEDIQPNELIKGRVTNENGEPVPGATVGVKGVAFGAITNAKGEFVLQNVDPATAILVITAINIERYELKLNGRSEVSVVVKTKTSPLDEVMVIGYGTTTQRTSTSSISKITSKDIEKQPVTNPLQALSGRIPGLLISENSGTPGAGISVQIRAANSLSTGTAPLFIVDGVPYLSESVYTAGGNTVGYLKPAFGNSPLNAINPSDIESIDVLKDADATAIYGSRGANGVILITTKKGKAGKTKFEVNASTGFSAVANLHRVKELTMPQYLEMRRAAYLNAGMTPTVAKAPDLLLWDTTKTTDFQKLLIGGTAKTHDASASFSGGNNQTTFLLSGAYHDEGAVVPGDNGYNRGAIHINLEHSTPDKKFTATISASYIVDKNRNIAQLGAAGDLALNAYTIAPNYPLYDTTGKNLYWTTNQSLNFTNPLSYQNTQYTSKNNNLIGNIQLKYTPVKGLNFKISTGYNKLDMSSSNLYYKKSINPYTSTLPSALFMDNYTVLWNVEPQVDFSHHISKGSLNLLAGSTLQGNKYVQPYYLVASNYSSDALLNNPSSAGTLSVYTSNSEYKYSSLFGRLNYNWINKYILNVNYRWDASSKFGINNRYGSFASVGAAWIFSEEDLFKKKLPWLSFGKLRGSYGSSGNDQISNYQYLDTYGTTYYGYNGVSGLLPNKLANPNLKWEVNKKLEVATELGFFKDRILITAAWFRNRTNNPLVTYPISTVTGFSSYYANLHAVLQQQGPEFTFTTVNLKCKNFNWTSSFNISFPQSKLVSFPGIASTAYASSKIVGESMSAIHLWHYTGIDPNTHLPTVLDANKDGSTSYFSTELAAYGRGDYVTVGKTDPDFYGGFNNSFGYKGVQLDIFIQFVGKKMVPGIGSGTYSASSPGYTVRNGYSGLYDLFKATNGTIANAKFDYSDGSPYLSYAAYSNSDAIISNAAYARLKNIALSYTLPQSWLQRVKMTNATLFVRGQNLFTVTKYNGFDPESPASNIPPLRTITTGLKFSF